MLVWQVKEGWGPLCKVDILKILNNSFVQFLGVPVPSEPFPNVNDTPTMLTRISTAKTLIAGTWAIVMAGLAGAAYYFL